VHAIERVSKAFLARMGLYRRILLTKEKIKDGMYRAARLLQNILRCVIARARVMRLRVKRERWVGAAVCVQRYVRARRSTFVHLVHWKRDEVARKKAWARNVLGLKLPGIVHAYLAYNRVQVSNHTHTHIHIYIYHITLHTYIYTYIYIYTHIHIYIYTIYTGVVLLSHHLTLLTCHLLLPALPDIQP
jgi:hypothetical protein